MDAQLKAKWVEALRSGKFKQGEGRLHEPKEDSFCCLGVLASICGAEFGPVKVDEGDDDGPTQYDYEATIDGYLISEPQSEEFKTEFTIKLGIPDQHELIARNDGHRLLDPGHPEHLHKHTFAEIADYIEANIPSDSDALPSSDRATVGEEK